VCERDRERGEGAPAGEYQIYGPYTKEAVQCTVRFSRKSAIKSFLIAIWSFLRAN